MDTKKIINAFIENGDFSGFGKLMDVASYYDQNASTHKEALKNIADIVLDQFEYMDTEEILEVDIVEVAHQEADSMVDRNASDIFSSAGLFANYTNQALFEYETPDKIDEILRL